MSLSRSPAPDPQSVLADFADNDLSSDNLHFPIASDQDTKTAGLELSQLSASERRLISDSRSCATRRAYRRDWAHFSKWCAGQGVPSLPARPDAVVRYLDQHQGVLAVATLQRKLIAIGLAHRSAHVGSPTKHELVRLAWQGLRNSRGVAQDCKSPIRGEELRALIAQTEIGLLGYRDRALLLLGFAAALRRSELVALDVADIQEVPEGLIIHIRRSKTDQAGEGAKVPVAFASAPDVCPVRAVRIWLASARIEGGPVFRSVDRHGRVSPKQLTDQSVALVVKRLAGAAGLDAAKFSGHSLRAGMATTAALNGASERQIAKITRHRSEAMVRRYVREATLWKDTAATKLGL